MRLGSFIGSTALSWTASPSLLAAVHLDVRACVAKAAIYDRQGSCKVGLVLACPSCERTKISKLAWLLLDGPVGSAPLSMEGPFCVACLKKHKTGVSKVSDIPVYYVLANDLLLTAISNFKPPSKPVTVSTVPDDLF